jgi:hypothetical protein
MDPSRASIRALIGSLGLTAGLGVGGCGGRASDGGAGSGNPVIPLGNARTSTGGTGDTTGAPVGYTTGAYGSNNGPTGPSFTGATTGAVGGYSTGSYGNGSVLAVGTGATTGTVAGYSTGSYGNGSVLAVGTGTYDDAASAEAMTALPDAGNDDAPDVTSSAKDASDATIIRPADAAEAGE